ncbi:MAG: hypothetical protein IKC37_01920 [Clostridia bacterium]|nr:hypothetical protein [Clostridia bacterium]
MKKRIIGITLTCVLGSTMVFAPVVGAFAATNAFEEGTKGALGDYESSMYPDTSFASDEWRKEKGYNSFYFTQLGDEVMPIGGWSSPPPAMTVSWPDYAGNPANTLAPVSYPNQITLSNYQTMKESGINFIHGLHDKWTSDPASHSAVMDALKYAGEVGMVYIVKDDTAYENINKYGVNAIDLLSQEYMTQPAYGGTGFVDEPGVKHFEALGSATQVWRAHEIYGETKLAFVNHLPSYAFDGVLWHGAHVDANTINDPNCIPDLDGDGRPDSAYPAYSNNYDAYVEKALADTQPQVYSYDFYAYPYTYEGNTADSASWLNYRAVLEPKFYQSLNDIRKKTIEANVPFWSFVQVGSYTPAGVGVTPRELTYSEIAMPVHTALAYGAKGIQWFNYWQPVEFHPTHQLCGMVDHNGNKLDYYYYCQAVNEQIAAVDHVLMKSASKGIIYVGSTLDPHINHNRFQQNGEVFDELTSYGAVTSVTRGDVNSNAVVGCFEYQDKGYAYYIASANVESSSDARNGQDPMHTGANSTITLNFDGEYTVEKIQRNPALFKTESTTHTGNSITVTLTAGEGALIVVRKK